MPHLHIFLWLLQATLAQGILEEHQYCSARYRRLCQGKGRHVACQFPDPGSGPSCRKYMQIKFTSELKHFITSFVNRRRQRIAAGNERVRGGMSLPKPQVMMLVEWDRELASLAQRLADQCNFIHDDCRATVRYPYAGQTVGEVRWRRSSESDELTAQRAIRRVLDAWWGERRRVQPKQLTSPFRLTSRGTVWGHFSQLSVWNLQAVGCGAVRHGSLHSRMLLVCDFSHTNMLGQRTLVVGPQAPCPIHTARRPRTPYPLLCSPVRHQIPHAQDDLHADYGEDDDSDDLDDDEDRVEVANIPTLGSWVRKDDNPNWGRNDEKPSWMRNDDPSSRVRIDDPSSRVRIDDHSSRVRIDDPSSRVRIDDPSSRVRIDDHSSRVRIDDKPSRVRNDDQPSWVRNDDKSSWVRIDDKPSWARHDKVTWKNVKEPVYHHGGEDEEIPKKARVESPRKGTVLINPERDLVVPSDTERYQLIAEDDTHRDWQTKKSYFERWREDQEKDQYLPDAKPTRVTTTEEPPATLQAAELQPSTQDDVSWDHFESRHRWKQTRIRPQRPGANALLSYTSTAKQSRKPVVASLMLDKDDFVQLFQDTGFSLHWKKPPP